MHIQGDKVISRATAFSARTLLIMSISTILVMWWDLDVAQLTFLEMPVKEGFIEVGAFSTILFQAVNHFIHWRGDFLSMQSWNSGAPANDIGTIDAGSTIITKLERVIERLSRLEDHKGDDLKGSLASTRKELDKIRHENVRLYSYAGFYLYIWHLAVPLIAACVSLLFLAPSILDVWQNTQ